MAVGIPFPEANLILTAPTAEDAAAGTVYDLYAHRYIDIDGRPRIISKWQFQPDELAQVVANDGVFWFHAWGATHPPVAVEGANPFVRAGQGVAPAAEERPNAADWRNRAERAEAECAELREKVTGLVADKARLDYLDLCSARLNARYGTKYMWELILNHNINRLMLGHLEVDLNDSAPNGLPSCRDAIDKRMREAIEQGDLFIGNVT